MVTPFDHKSIPNPQNSLLIDYIPYEFIDPNTVLIFLKRDPQGVPKIPVIIMPTWRFVHFGDY